MSGNSERQTLSPTYLALTEQLSKVLDCSNKADHQVARYLPADQLADLIDVSLGEKGCTEQEIIEALQNYLRYTPKSEQPEFSKLLFSGLNRPAVLADWVTSISNTTMHTYQVAPVASLMELELINQLNHLIGFDNGDGLMVSGGSMANMVGMMLARHRKCPDIKEQGFTGKTLVAYVSELSHYSFEKAANLLGIGSQNLISIETDSEGRLKADALEHAMLASIDSGKQPFFIGLTAGTTIIGSFDPVKECARIAKQYSTWLHIDGAWGGPVLFSQQHRKLLAHSHLADSFTWDAHKLMNVPLTASAILVKNNTILTDCCAGGGAAYLFHEDENTAFNIGTKSLQCGRRVDSLKFWSSWRAMGSIAYADKIDRLMLLKQTMLKKISATSNLVTLAPASFLNVLFRYEPDIALPEDALSALNIAICKRLLRDDLCFVDYAHYKGKTGIRYILANDSLDEVHINQFLENCRRTGDVISEELKN